MGGELKDQLMDEQVVNDQLEKAAAVPGHELLVERYGADPSACPYLRSLGAAGVELVDSFARAEQNPDRGPTMKELMAARKLEKLSQEIAQQIDTKPEIEHTEPSVDVTPLIFELSHEVAEEEPVAIMEEELAPVHSQTITRKPLIPELHAFTDDEAQLIAQSTEFTEKISTPKPAQKSPAAIHTKKEEQRVITSPVESHVEAPSAEIVVTAVANLLPHAEVSSEVLHDINTSTEVIVKEQPLAVETELVIPTLDHTVEDVTIPQPAEQLSLQATESAVVEDTPESETAHLAMTIELESKANKGVIPEATVAEVIQEHLDALEEVLQQYIQAVEESESTETKQFAETVQEFVRQIATSETVEDLDLESFQRSYRLVIDSARAQVDTPEMRYLLDELLKLQPIDIDALQSVNVSDELGTHEHLSLILSTIRGHFAQMVKDKSLRFQAVSSLLLRQLAIQS